jgi:hypothetical protein
MAKAIRILGNRPPLPSTAERKGTALQRSRGRDGMEREEGSRREKGDRLGKGGRGQPPPLSSPGERPSS